jgi:hypothetical protein
VFVPKALPEERIGIKYAFHFSPRPEAFSAPGPTNINQAGLTITIRAEIRVGLHVRVCYCYPILINTETSRYIFKAPHSNTFHENPFRGSRVVKADGQNGAFLQLFAPTKRVVQYSIQRCITGFPPSLWANDVAVLSTWPRPHPLKSLLVTTHNNLLFYSIYHYNSTVK